MRSTFEVQHARFSTIWWRESENNADVKPCFLMLVVEYSTKSAHFNTVTEKKKRVLCAARVRVIFSYLVCKLACKQRLKVLQCY